MRCCCRRMWALLVVWVLVFRAFGTPAQGQGINQILAKNFRQPPASAKPHTWWHWVNDNVSREGITADLEALAKAGVGGVQIFHVDVGVPAGAVKFHSPEWFTLFRNAVQEAARLGLEVCVHNCAGWSSSGGPWVKPEHAMQMVVFSQVRVKGPTKLDGKLPQPETRAGFYRDIAVLAFPTPQGNLRIENLRVKAAYERGNNVAPAPDKPLLPEAIVRRASIVNLTKRLQPDGRLVWDVPEGDWTILRIGHTPTGKDNHPATLEGRGLEVDKMSREALSEFWRNAITPLLRESSPLVGKVFNNVLVDSYEVGCQNWTPKFPEEFHKRRGYDLTLFLPVLAGYIVDGLEISERFLWDFRRTVAELFAENYYGYFAELCHRNGLLFSTEPYGNGPFEDLVCGGTADIPMGEFWVGGWGFETCKLAASAAHLYGKRLVGAEAFTADPSNARWRTHPFMLKALGDRAFSEGINRLIFHTTAHQPWFHVLPAMTMGPWGSHFGRTVTWWAKAKAWIDYLTRCQYLLQQGVSVGDILFFVGEHAPTSGVYRPDLKAKGYDYDACPADVLLNRVSVRDGKFVLPDSTSYEVLVLPNTDAVTPWLLRKLRELIWSGATVIGPKPTRSPSLQGYPGCDEEVRKLAEEIWGNLDGKQVTKRTFGKGQVYWGKSVEEVLALKGIKPDLEVRGDAFTTIHWIHRRVGNVDIYFVANQRERWEAIEGIFRVKGKVPELWHPDTGEIEPAPAFWEHDRRTVVPLRLAPYGSLFVVFRPQPKRVDPIVAFTCDGQSAWQEVRPRARTLEIRRAIYGVLNDPSKCVDVTEHLRKMVRNVTLIVEASNRIAGDPAFGIVKQLRVDYAVDGEERTVIVQEGTILQLPEGGQWLADFVADLRFDSAGRLEVWLWKSGKYELQTASGRRWRFIVPSVPLPKELTGPWEVRFPPKWGAPEKVRLGRLISWSQHPDPGIRYFSGTAIYVTEFEIPSEWLKPDRALVLDLGVVRHIAEVMVNGVPLGVFWKPPFRIDITKVVKAGRNRLEVRVTNTWVNRLIGDEELPDDCEWHPDGRLRAFPEWFVKGLPRPSGRLTFTTWKHYRKGDPLEEAGLLGPVQLLIALRRPLTK